MSTFESAPGGELRPAPRVVPLPPSAFADEWHARPKQPVPVGLRRIAEADVQTARAEAAALAWQLHERPADVDHRNDAYNDALMRWAVARGTCRPDDASQPFFRGAEDNVRAALTSEGVRFLYHHLERLHIEESPLVPRLDDDGVAELVARLATPTTLTPTARRLLGLVFEEVSRCPES